MIRVFICDDQAIARQGLQMILSTAPVDPNIAGKIFTGFAQQQAAPTPNRLIEALSDREIEVLRLMANGKFNAEVGQQIHLSEGTVRNYTSTIFAKLNVNDRTQAVVTAIRCGIIHLNDV